ncbi:MAG: proline--tRNA ligase [Termitinemataceae bacterium]|nr:MAG: proline--tRNA ligase [Termitinemataceae bacterium]
MKISKFFLPTLREVPADAVIVSHRLMMRSGMIRRLANGLFAYLPLGLRSFRKLENIIREEMNAIGALEIKPPVVVPGELWKESGRWDSMGDALLRVKNRLGGDFVVSPTAEEAFTALVRDEISSYKQLPLSIYQINTKYRDEVRPRYGVMRGREFVMKDAYSFHENDESLDVIYNDMGAAYKKIFERCSLAVIPVQADSGAMGGSGSSEFMVESEIGDNTLLLCTACGYAANVEKAECQEANSDEQLDQASSHTQNKARVENIKPCGSNKYELIDTPETKTIDELCAFLKSDAKKFIKTLIYKAVNVQQSAQVSAVAEAFFAVCIRGDLTVNETKLAAVLKAADVMLADDADVVHITGAPVGFAGPVGLKTVPIVADKTVMELTDAVCGALQKDKHYKNVNASRDFTPFITADVRTVVAGDLCPVCGKALYEKKGNELGHIFKLGRKYTKSMHVSYLDADGKAQTPTMGCYGIGLDRTLASVIEEHHDDAGIIWPLSLAPFHVVIVPVKYDGAVKEAADKLQACLTERGIEVLLDDRSERAGVKFNDADLIGFPWRIVMGDKNLNLSPPKVELKKRNTKDAEIIDLDKVVEKLASEIHTTLLS